MPSSPYRFVLPCCALLALLLVGMGALPGCQETPRLGLYLTLRHTYYPEDLSALTHSRLGRQLTQLLPELGVFDASRGVLTDFQGSFSVSVEGNSSQDPLEQALAHLPSRLRTAFSPDLRLTAWIYLHRAPRVDDGFESPLPGGQLGVPPFDPGDAVQRRALVLLLVRLKGLGFDGVQVDLEPFPEADVPAMVQLLQELRMELGEHFFRSVFAPKYVRPGAEAEHPGYAWTRVEPFQLLAAEAEQVVVPLYDFGSLAPDKAAYQARVAALIDDLVPQFKPASRLWLAFPAFKPSPQHGHAERLEAALPVLRRKRPELGGIVLFTYSGEAGDLQPRKLRRLR